ncbi:MAG: VOC family protein [Oscillospiraceae bacterium]|jgi:catechol 2,3-dioxygenase-like lactoylglutathione lyase family enzyme|nr:VOC family protein [Oscillospiraceae bacterium]
MIEGIIGIALDCKDANQLADFYQALTGWKKELSSDEWAALRTPQGILLVFQTVDAYEPPVWPWVSGKQQQMAHIDFKVDDLQEAVALAIQWGAKKADVQYFDASTVMLDPAGHPFCLSTVAQ